jgi:hypothetical protein
VTKRSLQFPDAVREALHRRYARQKRHWLAGGGEWPLVITLGHLSESEAARQVDYVRTWIDAWRQWRGSGILQWQERRWPNLGAQRLPGRLLLDSAEDVAAWLGETSRWRAARDRFSRLSSRWPLLTGSLARHFEMLAEYPDLDFERLESLLVWLSTHLMSNLYPRQLPIAGLDSKWLESRRGLVTDLVAALRGMNPTAMDFHRICGLRPMPNLIRLRLLDPVLRERVGGLGDITAPVEEIAKLTLSVQCVYIVENLQTGLAFDELPGAVILMGMGYAVDQLAHLKWLGDLRCIYWGDIDTHGLAILNRARAYLPGLKSLLMDEQTLLRHNALWVEEKQQHPADVLPNLTADEQSVYCGLKQHRWGFNVRLEQERIAWSEAWNSVLSIHH